MNSPKIKSFKQIKTAVEKLKRAGKKVVFTNGCFDILHIGHIKLLKQAKSFGDILVVGINSDSSVKKIKGPKRPINCENDRTELLASLSMVDFVVKFFKPTPYELIKIIKPHILVKGSDWKSDEIIGREFSGKVRRVHLKSGYSTTAIIRKIKGI